MQAEATVYYRVQVWMGCRWELLNHRFAERLLADRAVELLKSYLPSHEFCVRQEEP